MNKIEVNRADWDMRPKTKFITIEGAVLVESYDDEVIARVAEPQGFNPTILLIEVEVIESGGPKKQQPMPYFLRELTVGTEEWEEVAVRHQGEVVSMRITKLQWA